MAVIGSKGTYAQVQAPKDYLGNALSNVEQMNFKYREERRQQEELKLAREAAAEKERLARQDKAFEETKNIKPVDYGVPKMTSSANNVVRELSDEIYKLKLKGSLSSEEQAKIAQNYQVLDMMKMASENMKKFSGDFYKKAQDGQINLEVLGPHNDYMEYITNIENGEVFFDKQTGTPSVKFVHPETGEEKVESLKNLSDPSYLMSLYRDKVQLVGDKGVYDNLKKILTPQENVDPINGQIITDRFITPQQEEQARVVAGSIVSNDFSLKDVAQQLGKDFNWKDDKEKEKLREEVVSDLVEQTKGGLNLGKKTKTDDAAASRALQLRGQNITAAHYRNVEKNSGGAGGKKDITYTTKVDPILGTTTTVSEKITPDELEKRKKEKPTTPTIKTVDEVWNVDPISAGMNKTKSTKTKRKPATKATERKTVNKNIASEYKPR